MAAAIRSLYSRKDGERFKLPLNDAVASKVAALVKALRDVPLPPPADSELKELPKDEDDLIKLAPEDMKAVLELQNLFFTATTATVDGSTMNRFKCPVLSYIACFAYEPDDTFKTASEITPMLAIWKFLLRATALFEARQAYPEDDNQAGLYASACVVRFAELTIWLGSSTDTPRHISQKMEHTQSFPRSGNCRPWPQPSPSTSRRRPTYVGTPI